MTEPVGGLARTAQILISPGYRPSAAAGRESPADAHDRPGGITPAGKPAQDRQPHRRRVITAALILTSALMVPIETGSRLFGYPAIAMVLFLICTGLGIVIVLGKLFDDRKARLHKERGPAHPAGAGS